MCNGVQEPLCTSQLAQRCQLSRCKMVQASSVCVCVCGYRAREHCRGMVSAVEHVAIAV